MVLLREAILAILLICFIAIPGHAQENVEARFSLGAGVKSINSEVGFGMDGKITLNYQNFYSNINPLDLTFVPAGAQEGYRSETTSDGRDICRNTRNGRFAEKSKCSSVKTFYAFSTDLNYMLEVEGAYFVFGLGYRLSTNPTPYFNATVLFDPVPFSRPYHWYGTINGGSKYFKLGVGVTFDL